MNKTTLNQSVITPKLKTSLFLTLLLALCSVVSFAQFKVNPNTIFTANNVVSSKEEANVFDSSVLGESQIVLNGQNQHLQASKSASLPTLKVEDANELTITTELKLRGDLVVETGVLKLDHPLHVEGKVLLGDDVLIYNEHFLIYENLYLVHQGVTSTTTLEMFSSAPFLIKEYSSDSLVAIATSYQPITSINECDISQYEASPFSPPPEVA